MTPIGNARNGIEKFLLTVLVVSAGAAMAAPAETVPEPRNVVQLAASGSVEAQHDWLTLSLSVTKEGSDGAAVQNYLRQATDTALNEVKKAVQAGALEVHTGAFSLQPRYTNDGKINGWVGTSELVLEGADFGRISSTAVKALPMTISNLSFSLSRASRVRLEDQARKLAIERFRAKAADIAKDFGFQDYVLREVSVSAQDQQPLPRGRMMVMSARVASDVAPVALEGGKSEVQVTVSGGIQLK